MFADPLVEFPNEETKRRFAENYTDVPSHLLECVYNELIANFHEHSSESVLDEDHGTDELSNFVNVAIDSCKWRSVLGTLIRIIAMVFGIPGNIMSAMVSLTIDRITSSVFLTSLSVGDLLTVILRTTTTKTQYPSFEVLKVMSGFFPNSVLVLICFERYMAVNHPFKKKQMFTLKTAYSFVASLVLLFFVVFVICYFLILSEIPHHVKMFIMAGLLFGIPCPLILTFNWLTVRALKQMSSTLQSNMQSTFLSKAEWSITFMIIVASVVFIVLNAPLFVTCLMWFLMEISDQMHNELVHSKITFFIKMSYWLTFLHHGVNFYVYILGTRRFRQQFLFLLRRYTPFCSDNGNDPIFLTPTPSHNVKSQGFRSDISPGEENETVPHSADQVAEMQPPLDPDDDM